MPVPTIFPTHMKMIVTGPTPWPSGEVVSTGALAACWKVSWLVFPPVAATYRRLPSFAELEELKSCPVDDTTALSFRERWKREVIAEYRTTVAFAQQASSRVTQRTQNLHILEQAISFV